MNARMIINFGMAILSLGFFIGILLASYSQLGDHGEEEGARLAKLIVLKR